MKWSHDTLRSSIPAEALHKHLISLQMKPIWALKETYKRPFVHEELIKIGIGQDLSRAVPSQNQAHQRNEEETDREPKHQKGKPRKGKKHWTDPALRA